MLAPLLGSTVAKASLVGESSGATLDFIWIGRPISIIAHAQISRNFQLKCHRKKRQSVEIRPYHCPERFPLRNDTFSANQFFQESLSMLLFVSLQLFFKESDFFCFCRVHRESFHFTRRVQRSLIGPRVTKLRQLTMIFD